MVGTSNRSEFKLHGGFLRPGRDWEPEFRTTLAFRGFSTVFLSGFANGKLPVTTRIDGVISSPSSVAIMESPISFSCASPNFCFSQHFLQRFVLLIALRQESRESITAFRYAKPATKARLNHFLSNPIIPML